MKFWEVDKDWADGQVPQIECIVRQMVVDHVGEIVVLRVASSREDTKEATDYVIDVAPGTIACRVRRPQYQDHRDLTIRWSRPSDVLTEAAKIHAGWARWYLYCWQDGERQLSNWIWVDLDRVAPVLVARHVEPHPLQQGRFVNIQGHQLASPLRPWLLGRRPALPSLLDALMPAPRRRPCRVCGVLTLGPLCAKHRRAREQARGTAAQRGYDGDWRRLRDRVITEWVAQHGWWCPGWRVPPHPVPPGRLVGAHRTPFPQGGRLDPANVGVLCGSCNTREMRDRAAGR